ncbi:MAG TPA: fasciclin domain-containing protein [Chitinophagaceae bacterium]|jgi:uncharacterized surface protein with fasciclin (FAS1) repeats
MPHTKLYPLVFAILCLLSSACRNSESGGKNSNTTLKSAPVDTPGSKMTPSKTIAENISNDSAFAMLSASLKTTNLYDMLSKPGPFTFFAPRNIAFTKLPDGMLEGLINDRKNDLANILSHHIVAGLIPNGELTQSQKLKTVAGEELIVTERNNEIIINGVKINSHGIQAKNGMVYIIDDLFFPINQTPGAY